MYTGEMIDNLIEKVQKAEQTAFLRVTQGRRRTESVPPAFNPLFTLNRTGELAASRHTIEVA